MYKLHIFLFITAFAISCATNKNAVHESGTYEQTLELAKKLKASGVKQRKCIKLSNKYNASTQWLKKEIAIEQEQNNSFKWNTIATHMAYVNKLSDTVSSVPCSKEYINDFLYYTTELEDAKKQAAQEFMLQAKKLKQYHNNTIANKMALLYLKKARKLDSTIPAINVEISALEQRLKDLKQKNEETQSE